MKINETAKARFRQVRRRIKKMPFLVWVWGPGLRADSLPAQKRRKLQEDLEEVVGSGNVLISEDISESEDDDPIIKDIQRSGDYASEWVQARVADAVIIIPESPGSITETALYRGLLRGKSLLFVTRRVEKGFTSEAYVRFPTQEVDPQEWEQCDRVRRLAREFIEQLRIDKFALKSQTFSWD